MADKVQFRTGPLTDQLVERAAEDSNAAISVIAAREIGRYHELLALALARVGLTEGEAGLLVDLTNGTIFEPLTVAAQALHYEVQDAEDSYFPKWEVDRAMFVTKLRGYSLLERAAICDAIERFWGDSYHIDNTRTRMVRVGLTRP